MYAALLFCDDGCAGVRCRSTWSGAEGFPVCGDAESQNKHKNSGWRSCIVSGGRDYLKGDGNPNAFTNGFENCGLKLDNLEDELLAEKLKAEIGASAVGVTQTIGADGMAGFSGLEEGIYLVVQTKAANGYEMFSPFLVSLPMRENGQWKYQVEAMPKIEVSVSGKPETPVKQPVSTPKPVSSGNNLRLPYTGQLIWPVPVMAIAGMLLFAVGWSLRKDKKTE